MSFVKHYCFWTGESVISIPGLWMLVVFESGTCYAFFFFFQSMGIWYMFHRFAVLYFFFFHVDCRLADGSCSFLPVTELGSFFHFLYIYCWYYHLNIAECVTHRMSDGSMSRWVKTNSCLNIVKDSDSNQIRISSRKMRRKLNWKRNGIVAGYFHLHVDGDTFT